MKFYVIITMHALFKSTAFLEISSTHSQSNKERVIAAGCIHINSFVSTSIGRTLLFVLHFGTTNNLHNRSVKQNSIHCMRCHTNHTNFF